MKRAVTACCLVLVAAHPIAASQAEDVLFYDSRDQIPEASTRDLADVFPSPEAFEAAFETVSSMGPQIATFEGRLRESPEALAAALDARSSLASAVEDLGVYASSFAAGEAIAERFRAGDDTAVNDYLAALKLGGSVYPMDVLETAGVDLTDTEVIATVMGRYREITAEMEKLLLPAE